MEDKKIIFHMLNEIIEALLGSGLRSSNSTVGGSVARASAARVSIIKLTQRSCTAVIADASWLLATADTNARMTAVTLADS